VTVLDGPDSGRSIATDDTGVFRFSNLQRGDANLSATALGCLEDRRGTFVDGANTLDFSLQCDSIPRLLSPAGGATVANFCEGAPIVWRFDWSDVPGANAYHLYVIGPRTSVPAVDDQSLQSSQYEHHVRGFFIDENAPGWQWRVRARIGDTWRDWSNTGTFNVQLRRFACPPVIKSVSPPSPAASSSLQQIYLIGDRLIPGTVTATSPTGRHVTGAAAQPNPNPFGLQLNQTVETSLRLDEAGNWTIRLDDIREGQSNAFAFTVR
jgi:hypothetical protein